MSATKVRLFYTKCADERKGMTGSQKAIKVLSILLIIISVLAILIGLVTMAGGMAVVGAGSQVAEADQEFYATGAGLLLFLGVGSLISGVIDLIIGIFGVRGAKDPHKIKPFFVISIIGLVLALLSLMVSISSGAEISSIVSNVVTVVILGCCVYFSNNIRKLNQ